MRSLKVEIASNVDFGDSKICISFDSLFVLIKDLLNVGEVFIV